MRLVIGFESSDPDAGVGNREANPNKKAFPAFFPKKPLERPVAISVFNVTVSISPN